MKTKKRRMSEGEQLARNEYALGLAAAGFFRSFSTSKKGSAA